MHLYYSKVIENKKVAKDIFKLTIQRVDKEKWLPGNFAMILPEPKPEFFSWRRAFSIFYYDESKLEFLIKKVGLITSILEKITEDDKISYIGPLGNSFQLPHMKNNEKIFLVAGGLGIAPLHLLIYELNKKNYPFDLFYGVYTKSELIDLKNILSCNNKITYSTEDGSFGYKGKITELLNLEYKKSLNILIYACGPFGMLYEIYKFSLDISSKIQISVETTMACGFGVCRGCAIPLKDNSYKMVCKDGPVFNINEINWDLWRQILQ